LNHFTLPVLRILLFSLSLAKKHKDPVATRPYA
jgi:hypothetical protein